MIVMLQVLIIMDSIILFRYNQWLISDEMCRNGVPALLMN